MYGTRSGYAAAGRPRNTWPGWPGPAGQCGGTRDGRPSREAREPGTRPAVPRRCSPDNPRSVCTGVTPLQPVQRNAGLSGEQAGWWSRRRLRTGDGNAGQAENPGGAPQKKLRRRKKQAGPRPASRERSERRVGPAGKITKTAPRPITGVGNGEDASSTAIDFRKFVNRRARQLCCRDWIIQMTRSRQSYGR